MKCKSRKNQRQTESSTADMFWHYILFKTYDLTSSVINEPPKDSFRVEWRDQKTSRISQHAISSSAPSRSAFSDYNMTSSFEILNRPLQTPTESVDGGSCCYLNPLCHL